MSNKSKVIYSYDSYQYNQVYKILEMKDDCVWKTKSLGFIHRDEQKNYKDCVFSSISTHLTGKGVHCTLYPYIGEF